jgi:hypothetical protein
LRPAETPFDRAIPLHSRLRPVAARAFRHFQMFIGYRLRRVAVMHRDLEREIDALRFLRAGEVGLRNNSGEGAVPRV